MSSNQRPNVNVGIGTLRESDEKEFTVNEGWDFFQKHLPDDSVIDSENFSISPNDIRAQNQFVFRIPQYPECFLDPSSLRLNGKCKLVHKVGTTIQDALPKNTAVTKDVMNPEKIYELQAVTLGNDQVTAYKGLDSAQKIIDGGALAVMGGANMTTPYFYKLGTKDKQMQAVCAQVVPENLMCQAMWKDVEVKINSQTVSKNANLEYAHKAYFETLLSYGTDAMDTHMTAEMWNPDLSEEIKGKGGRTGFEADYKNTKSFHIKREKYSKDNWFNFSMQLHTELNSINGFLPENLEYTFKFVKNDPQFFLRMTTADAAAMGGQYDIEFEDLTLTGTFMKPSPKVLSAFRNFISKNDAIYKTVRTSIITKTVEPNKSQFDFVNMLATDKLPDQIFVAMVSTKAKLGAYEMDPFYFHHYDMSNVRLQVNNRNYPVEAYTPDFDSDMYAQLYRGLFENTSIKTNNIGLTITPTDFKFGSSILAWDLNHDACAGAHSNHSDMYGAASLHILFKRPLPEDVTVIVASVYRDYMSINQWGKTDVMTGHGIAQLYQNKMDLS